MFLLIHEDFTVQKTLTITSEDRIGSDMGHLQIIDITGCEQPKEFLNTEWIDVETHTQDETDNL